MEDDEQDQNDEFPQQRESENVYYSDQDGTDPLLRLQKYIGREQISLETFWDSTQTQITPDQFFDFCRKKAIKFNSGEETSLMRILCDNNNYISYQSLCYQIPYWKNDEGKQTFKTKKLKQIMFF